MGTIITNIQGSLSGLGYIPLIASVIWGIFSVLLSPCSLVSIPLVIGYIQSEGGKGTKNALMISGVFSLGILVNIALVGAVIASAGALLEDLSSTMNYIVSIALFIFGLHLLEVIRIPWFISGKLEAGPRRGLRGALVLGLLSGMAMGPCTFAYMAPMLMVALKAASNNLIYGISLVVAYGLGYCSVIMAAGGFADLLDRYMNWSENSKGSFIISQICGWLVILAGAYFLYHA